MRDEIGIKNIYSNHCISYLDQQWSKQNGARWGTYMSIVDLALSKFRLEILTRNRSSFMAN